MSKEQQKATWTFLMMTALKKQFGVDLPELVRIEGRYRLIRFLMEHYDLLHYYDNDYIVGDMEKYIEEQGGDIRALRRAG